MVMNVLPQSRVNTASRQQMYSAHTVGGVFRRPGTFLHPSIQQVLFGDPSCPRHCAETSITQTRCPYVGPFRNKSRCHSSHPTPKRDYTLHCNNCWEGRDGGLTAKKPEGELARLSGLWALEKLEHSSIDKVVCLGGFLKRKQHISFNLSTPFLSKIRKQNNNKNLLCLQA